jgi:endonuclease V-like protein UPF0215 family
VPVHVHKKAVRALGIAESFIKGYSKRSVLTGVVMRADRIIDGFVFSAVTVGGMDATEKIIEMYTKLGRNDINFLLLNGCIISWYNVMDLHQIAEKTSCPILCVTYEESDGLEPFFKELFPNDWKKRVEIYRNNGTRTSITLHTGYNVLIRFIDMALHEAKGLLNKFTLHGSVSEPLKVARLLARSIIRTPQAQQLIEE